MTWTDVQRAAELDYVPVLVVGSTEQHGPHLPLSTDVVIPTELVRRLAEQAPLLLAPPIHYGFKSKALSGGGQTFPGTTSLDGSTLIDVVRDVVGELARQGFRRLLVLNWHMENINFVWEGIDQARRLGRLGNTVVLSIDSLTSSFSRADLAWLFPEGPPGWDLEHASMVETSLMLALRPDLVRSQEIRDDAAREHPWYDLIPEPARHIPPSGVLANPSMATREIGERLCAMMLERLASALVREFGIVTRDAPATNGSAAGRPGSPESDNTCPTPTPGNQTAVSRELTGPTLGSRGHCGGENDLRLGDSAEDAGEPSAV